MSYIFVDMMDRVIGYVNLGYDRVLLLRDLALHCGLYFVSLGDGENGVQKFVVID